jgi:hypothetical protein
MPTAITAGRPAIVVARPLGPQGAPGPAGPPGQGIQPNASGTLAQRAAHDAAAQGFIYLQTDVTPFQLWVKRSNTSGDWAGPTPVSGAGATVIPYATRAAAVAASVPTAALAIDIAGYSAAGDQGGGQYVKVGPPGTVKPWHFQSLDGGWWELRANPVLPEHFGGGASPVNSTAAINAMLDYAVLTGSKCMLLSKQYDTDGNHQLHWTHDIEGSGSTETRVKLRTNANSSVFVIPYTAPPIPTDPIHPFVIPSMSYFLIDGNGANQSGSTGNGVDMPDGPVLSADGLNYGTGIALRSMGITGMKGWAIYAGINRNAGLLDDVAARYNTYGFAVKGGDWRASNSEFAVTNNYGIYYSGFASEFSACYIYSNALDNIYIDGGAQDVTFINGSCDRAGGHGFHIVGGSLRKSVVIDGMLFTHNSANGAGVGSDIVLDLSGGNIDHVIIANSRQMANTPLSKPAYFLLKLGSGTLGAIDYVANNMDPAQYLTGITNAPTALRSAGGPTIYMGAIQDATGLPVHISGVPTAWFEPAGGVRLKTGVYIGPTGIANRWASDGNLVISTQGYKPGGGSWVDTSDERIKNVLGDYAYGLDAVRRLAPVRYTFKGNNTADAPAPGKSTPYENSGHHDAAVSGREFIGLIAQEAETVLPGMVTQIPGYIDGEQVNDLRVLDTNELIYALVNAVRELATRIETLEAP